MRSHTRFSTFVALIALFSSTRAQADIDVQVGVSVNAGINVGGHRNGSLSPSLIRKIKRSLANHATDTFAEVAGGAAGDPASMGVAWMLASESGPPERSKKDKLIVDQEINFLMTVNKRTEDGAMSHRPDEEPVQLWNDWIYMVPPFLAYYGAVHRNETYIKEAYNQIRLYRQYLRDPATGIWKHILLGNWEDTTLWGTGNAWAAAGTARVLATIKHSAFRKLFATEMAELASWSEEILDGTFGHVNAEGFLPNAYFAPAYYSFSDGASTALLAATAFRLASLGTLKNQTHLVSAHRLRETVNTHVNVTTGWLTPSVDPLDWDAITEESPESMAFVLLLEAAHRDYHKL